MGFAWAQVREYISSQAKPRGLQERTPESPYEEIEQQNQELLKTLQELRARQGELRAAESRCWPTDCGG